VEKSRQKNLELLTLDEVEIATKAKDFITKVWKRYEENF